MSESSPGGPWLSFLLALVEGVWGWGGVGVACWEQFLCTLGWSGHPQILLPAKEELVASASFPLPPSPELAVSLRRDTSIDLSKPSGPRRPGPLSSQPAGWCYTRRGTHSHGHPAECWQGWGLALRGSQRAGRERGTRQRPSFPRASEPAPLLLGRQPKAFCGKR